VIALLLRAEWVALSVCGAALYLRMNGDPVWLLPLFFAADLSMLGYLAGPRPGAIVYNAVHNLVLALAALGIGWLAGIAPLALAGAVLVAHVGLDRALGYGLKHATGFADTHLGRLGRRG
jgi:hypothetical protein